MKYERTRTFIYYYIYSYCLDVAFMILNRCISAATRDGKRYYDVKFELVDDIYCDWDISLNEDIPSRANGFFDGRKLSTIDHKSFIERKENHPLYLMVMYSISTF